MLQHQHDHSSHGRAGGDEAILNRVFEVYVPRQECMFHQPDVIWTHVVSDILITSAYFSIPFALVYFYQRRADLAFNWIFILFATFIFACGLTHLFQVLAIWYPLYRLEGFVKVITAIASVGTATVLWPLIPKALALPSPAMLRAEIVERVRAEEALREVNEGLEQRVRERTAELERLNRIKDDFLATLSHELRTPLSAILGWASLLRQKDYDETACAEGLEVIERNARAQSRLVSDLLDMQRVISGKLYLDARTTDLAEIVTSAVQVVRPSADAKHITIETHFGQNIRSVWGDPDRLQQLLWNLLSNAVKFTPTGGLVRVDLEAEGSVMVVRVSDNGAGIEQDVLPYIFEKFRQADQSITRRYGGLGLGLAIVRHIAELHGGSVEVDSPGAGGGATFTVKLPAMTGATPAAHPTELTEAAAAITPPEYLNIAGTRILLVDDEPDSVRVIEQILTDRGCIVSAVTSVEDALAAFDEFAPDIVISDIAMPAQDGYDLIRQLRSRSDVPAIALTALARAEDIEHTAKAGFDVHLAKPVEPTQLVLTISSLRR